MAKNGAMMMKALTVASIFALGVAGTACSQAQEAAQDDVKAETEAVATDVAETEAAETAAADVGGSFNLGVPTEAPAANVGGSFNLGLPAAAPASTDGFNLNAGISASNGLSDLPEIDAPAVIEESEDSDDDEEPIIRLE